MTNVQHALAIDELPPSPEHMSQIVNAMIRDGEWADAETYAILMYDHYCGDRDVDRDHELSWYWFGVMRACRSMGHAMIGRTVHQ